MFPEVRRYFARNKQMLNGFRRLLTEEAFFIGTLESLNPARNEMVDSIII